VVDSGPGLSLNDDTDYGLCFVCGPKNECGLRLQFERVGDSVTTFYTPSDHHQGFPGVLHGGVITALLDEVMSRVSVVEGRWTQTARIEVRFRRQVLVGQTVTAVANQLSERRGFVEAEGWVLLPDGSVAAEATGTFAPVPDDALAQMSAAYPRLSNEWMVNRG
jgi:uncharacterized protein (TIGR00369 family)